MVSLSCRSSHSQQTVRAGVVRVFSNGASPAEAQKAYLAYVEALRAEGLKVETGSFGAHMHVRLTNDGPATFWLKF